MPEEYADIFAVIGRQLQIDPAEIRPDSRIVEELGADSIDIVEMLTAFEALYGLSVADDEIISFKTPEDILDYLAANGN